MRSARVHRYKHGASSHIPDLPYSCPTLSFHQMAAEGTEQGDTGAFQQGFCWGRKRVRSGCLGAKEDGIGLR